jgi:hypothetical protein
MLFLPLSTMNEGTAGPLYCGPGATNSPALFVAINPGQVDNPIPAGSDVGTINQYTVLNQTAENLCSGQAKGRLTVAVLLFVPLFLIGIFLPTLLRKLITVESDRNTVEVAIPSSEDPSSRSGFGNDDGEEARHATP